jgi:hypothetical protein
LCPSVALDGGFDHADHRPSGEAGLVGTAQVGELPFEIMANRVAANLQATVTLSTVSTVSAIVSAGGSAKMSLTSACVARDQRNPFLILCCAAVG